MKLFRFLLTLFLLLAACSLGCGPQQPEAQNKNSQPQLTGADILTRMVESYSSSSAYSDRAVLYMTYRTEEGQPVQEPMPWSVHYEKRTQKFSGRFYHSVVKYDGQLLGCQVFDIETENHGDQYLMISEPTLPLDRLLQDSEARRFLGGYSELPMRLDSSALVESLLPPTLTLLTGQVDFPWLTQPDQVTRLEDQLIEGVVCFHVQTQFRKQPCEFWIEQDTGLIHQILFPNDLLQTDLEEIKRIDDLKIVARFHDCKFNQKSDEKNFVITPPETANLVSEFVILPDAFPSDLIGKKAPELQFQSPSGNLVTSKSFADKPSAFFWVPAWGAEQEIKTFNELKHRYGDQVNFGLLYSEAQMKDPAGSSFKLNSAFAELLRSTGSTIPLYCDFNLNAFSQLQIKGFPSVIVMDEDSTIHFVKASSEIDWANELDATIQRVMKGENLAQEVIDEYGKFYSRYRAKLREVEFRFNQPSLVAQSVSTPINRTQRATTVWSSDSLLRPGNLSTTQIGDEVVIAVLDGFRTIVLLDESGKPTLRREINLPENQAVTRIRTSNYRGKLVVAVFNKLGSQVHWFDEQLQPMGKFPLVPSSKIKLEDCQFAKSNGTMGLLAAAQNTGLFQVNLESSEAKKVTSRSAKEFCITNQAVAGVDNGAPFCSTLPDFNPSTFSGWHFVDIQGNKQMTTDDDSENFCALGTTQDGVWQALGLDSHFTITWKANVGGQDFTNDIEPITTDHQHNVWLIASTEPEISIYTHHGELIDRREVEGELKGVATIPNQKDLRILYSAGGEIHCVEIKLGND